jgi:hypothetical protein
MATAFEAAFFFDLSFETLTAAGDLEPASPSSFLVGIGGGEGIFPFCATATSFVTTFGPTAVTDTDAGTVAALEGAGAGGRSEVEFGTFCELGTC